eukprot:TRINITY_DN11104_c0_g1_i1.p1 TRINITY_DN11104_c0_g1~~TRINITY_DN11104_c0_g1_i1.p1  ORF type:complete len:219 (-),score=-9.64 TRINITY_DN11104_c0_g1_i1:439-1095(-)
MQGYYLNQQTKINSKKQTNITKLYYVNPSYILSIPTYPIITLQLTYSLCLNSSTDYISTARIYIVPSLQQYIHSQLVFFQHCIFLKLRGETQGSEQKVQIQGRVKISEKKIMEPKEHLESEQKKLGFEGFDISYNKHLINLFIYISILLLLLLKVQDYNIFTQIVTDKITPYISFSNVSNFAPNQKIRKIFVILFIYQNSPYLFPQIKLLKFATNFVA